MKRIKLELTEDQANHLRTILDNYASNLQYTLTEGRKSIEQRHKEGKGRFTVTWPDGLDGTEKRLAFTKRILEKLYPFRAGLPEEGINLQDALNKQN